jgi:sec-independent protein translocase protein TatA
MTNAFIAGLGPLELGIILLIVLVIVGGKRLPQLGRQLGGGMREFKDTVTAKADKHFDEDDDDKSRADAPTALNRPAGEDEAPLDGEVLRERS